VGDDVVSRDTVILVLQKLCKGLGVELAVLDEHVILVKDGIPEVQALSDPVGKKVLQRLSHKFGIPIYCFFHPEQIVDGSKEKQ
jgi:hypothetical protein